ncbi:MAG TPA: BcsE family c-di-GMP-binding protein [Rhodocyclaceae bacterium]
MTSSISNSYCMGVPGLPPIVDSMVGGGLYAIQVSSPPARSALLSSVIGTSVRKGVPTAVCGGTPKRILQRAQELGFPELEDAARDGRLALFALKDAAAKNIFRHGAARFLLELDHFGVADGSLVVFEGAEELFTLQDPSAASEQVREYRDWFQQRDACGVFLFNLLSPNSHAGATYQSLLEYLHGAARLESRHEELAWLIEFWTSVSGVVASRSLPARLGSEGTLTISERSEAAAADPAVPEARDANDVFSLDRSLVDVSRQAAGQWIFADNLVGLLHACRNAVAATIILVYDGETELRQLAQAAHTLRITLGRRVRIVVRELDSSLRYQNELLLLNLGVNLILHREVPPSRLMLALESLKGQTFNRDIDVDFDAALASVAPTKLAGWLPPAAFAHEAAVVVDRSKALAVPYALVELRLPAPADADAALERFSIKRPGDLLTAADGKLYLFLSACPQVNLLATLRRLAGDGVEEAFPDMRFLVAEAEVRAELAAIGRKAGVGDAAGVALAQPA